MYYSSSSPWVSVVIPVYNCDRFVAWTVESVLQQSYTHYEVIVVDDGSTDNSYQVLQPYFDRIHYIYQDNQGVAAARNRGIQQATGDFIAFLDHDDYWLPDKLEKQVALWQQYPTWEIIHSGWRRVDTWGNALGNITPWQKAPTLDLEAWIRWKPVLLSAMLFRRDWLLQIGGLDTNFRQACDVDLVLRLTLRGCQTGWLQEITTCYREHDRNDSLNTTIQAQESWQVLDKFFQIPNLPIAIRQNEWEYRYYTLIWSAWRFYVTGDTEQMVAFLEKSLRYSPYFVTETVLDWIQCFQDCMREYNQSLDTQKLSSSLAWQQLTNTLFSAAR